MEVKDAYKRIGAALLCAAAVATTAGCGLICGTETRADGQHLMLFSGWSLGRTVRYSSPPPCDAPGY